MKVVIGLLAVVIGLRGLWAALRDRHLRDRSGWIYARQARQPVYFWLMTIVFALMIGTGGFLLYAGSTEAS